MSIASRHGKLSRFNNPDPNRPHRLEDLLTADVFTIYRYLPPAIGVWPFLASASQIDGTLLSTWLLSRGVNFEEDTIVEFEFWPKWERREADLLVLMGSATQIRQVALLVEAKLGAQQHFIGDKSQLGYYAGGHVEGSFDPENFGRKSRLLRPVLYLTNHDEMPTDELKRAERECSAYDGADLAFFWVNWQRAAIVAEAQLQRLADNRQDPQTQLLQARLLCDLVEDLAARGIRRPRPKKAFPLPLLKPFPDTPGWPRWFDNRKSI